MLSRPEATSLLPFDADPTTVGLGLAAVGVLAALALLVVLRMRRRRAARGRAAAGDPAVPDPATAAPGPAPAGPGVAPEAPGPDRVGLVGYVPAAPTPTPEAGVLLPGGPPPAGPPAHPAATPATPADPLAASSAAFAVAARRDISLLNRQLQALDELEQTETDPDTLQQLFLLDNLTMRLRRGAESLLVLAGSPPGRRVRDATPVSDVVRTASAQIEAYERVRVDLTDDPPLAAVHVVPVAHLLAELLENATVFSPPDTVVDVVGLCDPEAMHVTVRDSGLGMTADELDRAQAALGSRADVTAATDRLGLVVVGRLADRLGIGVTLAPRPDGQGTEVTLRLARELFDVAGPDDADVAPADTAPVLPEPVVLPPVLDPDTLAPPAGDGGVHGLVPTAEAYVPERTVADAPGEHVGVPVPRRTARSRAHAAEDAPSPRAPRGTSPEHAALPSFDAILTGAPAGVDPGGPGAPAGSVGGVGLPADPPLYGFVQPHPEVPHAPGSRRHAARPATEPVPVGAVHAAGPAAEPPTAPGPAAAPAAPGVAPGRTFLPQDPADAPSWSPQGGVPTPGWTGEQSSLAERASLQQQALAALSSMSSYRPQVAVGSAPTLARRLPAAVDAASDPAEEAIVRDAEALRARLTAFRAATRRAREDGAADPAHQPGTTPAPTPFAEEMR
ncbi:ATP-binding protein [Cellulomonas sp. Y8]|uniref:sensor histidine kinase n=1 Tax=Cellulomonas sp. Y8 TaxID=2591145 RepID=UPI003D753DC2